MGTRRSSRRQRILHIVPFLWSGAGSVITRLCVEQSARAEVGIVTTGAVRELGDWPEYRRRLRAAEVPHFQINFFDRGPDVFWGGVQQLADVGKAWRPDIVHCHSGVPACATALVRKAMNSSFGFVSHFHSWGLHRPEWMNTMDLSGFREADRVVCGSQAYVEILRKGGVPTDRIVYLPWGLPLHEIRRTAGARTTAGTRTHIGFVGRIEERKGQLDLAYAFERFHRRRPKSTLELIGPTADLKYSTELSRFVEKSGLAHAVKIRGKVGNALRRVRTWNLFVSMSRDEGQGLSVLEAMALGVPVIARRSAGIEDYLKDGFNGVELDTATPEDAAGKMERVIYDRPFSTALARAGRRTVEQRYDWDRNVRQLHGIYGTVSEGGALTHR